MSEVIVLVEGIDRRGNLLLRQRVALTPAKSTLTIGSGAEASVILADADLASIHVTLAVDPEGRLTATDHGATQGIVVDGTRHRGISGIALPTGEFQIGQTKLKAAIVRADISDKPVALAPSRLPLYIAIGAGLATIASSIYDSWAGAPTDLAVTLLWTLGALLVLSLVWISIWAELSRRNYGNPRWAIHSAIFFSTGLASDVIGKAAFLGAFAFSLPLLAQLNGFYSQVGLTLCVAIFFHLKFSRHWSVRTRLLVAFGLPMAFGSVGYWMNSRWQRTDVATMNAKMRLYPPAFKLARAIPPKDFFADAAALRAKAQAKLDAVPKSLLDQYEDALETE